MTTDEKKISGLYKQAEESGPPADLDNAILSAARNALQDDAMHGRRQDKISATVSTPLFAGPFSGGWRAFASIAAVLVITVILVPLLQQEEISPSVSRVADETPILKKEQDFIRATDVKKPVAAKENREVKKRSKMKVLELEQESQLHQAPAKTLNTNTFSSGKSFSAEEKISPVRSLPEISERSLSSAKKIQPASAAVGTAAPGDQALLNQESRVLAADKRPSVTMAAEPWLQKIRELIAQGDFVLAQKELDEFKLRYPDEDIDPLIVNQLK